MTRKPPVTAIKGSYQTDVVTQQELQTLAEAQEAEWRANRLSQKLALRVEERLADGARVQAGDLIFDTDLKMARAARTTRTKRIG